MKKLPKSVAGRKKIESLEREIRALELRKSGFTYQRIKEELGISISGVAMLLKRALGRLERQSIEGVSEYRRLQLERLDSMLFFCWDHAQKGDLNAIDRVLRIEERRSKLLGLDFPDQQPIGIDPKIIEAIISKLQDRQYDITQASLEISKMGASLPEAMRIMLSKTPPVVIANTFEALDTDELDRRALETLQRVQWQYDDFLPERRQEVIELKQELKGADAFMPGTEMKNE
jgi:hypothetical protein